MVEISLIENNIIYKSGIYAKNEDNLVGILGMHYDTCTGYVYDLDISSGQPITTGPRMILAAAKWFQERGVKSVMIHVSGKNVGRKFYRRLGFVEVPKVDGLMATTIQEVLDALARFDKE